MKKEILNVMLMDVIRIDEEQDANEEWIKTEGEGNGGESWKLMEDVRS